MFESTIDNGVFGHIFTEFSTNPINQMKALPTNRPVGNLVDRSATFPVINRYDLTISQFKRPFSPYLIFPTLASPTTVIAKGVG
jgi:hypothetical protein